MPAQPGPEEGSGLTKIMWFGIIYLAGLAVSWAVAFYVFGTIFTASSALIPPGSMNGTGFGPSGNATSMQALAAIAPVFQGLTLLLPISVSIELIALAVLTLGFRDLGKVDRSRFSTPSTLMLVMVAGTFVAAAGGLLVFSAITGYFTMASNQQILQPGGAMASVGSIFLGVVVVLIGGILSLVGLVGGLMLGLWRAGSRYNETLLKLGAIFVIIPFLNFVAPILVIVGAHGAKGRVAAGR